MKKMMKYLSIPLVVCLLAMLVSIPAAAATDHTPQADIELNYGADKLPTEISADDITGKLNYSTPSVFFNAGGKAYAPISDPDGYMKEPSGDAYWEYIVSQQTNSSGNYPITDTITLYLQPGKLLRLSNSGTGGSYSGPIYELTSSTAVGQALQTVLNLKNGNKNIAIQNPVGKDASFGTDSNNYNAGNLAVVISGDVRSYHESKNLNLDKRFIGDTYYVLTRDGEWAEAVAKVGNLYYSAFSKDDDSYTDTALEDAMENASKDPIYLLKDVRINDDQKIDLGGNSICCCNGSHLIVTTGGNLTLNSSVAGKDGSITNDDQNLILMNGGKITNNAENTVFATYTDNYNGTHSFLFGNNKDTVAHFDKYIKNDALKFAEENGILTDNLNDTFVGGSKTLPVDIRGTFKVASGYFYLLNLDSGAGQSPTSINTTRTPSFSSTEVDKENDAVIVGNGAYATLTVNGGRVHYCCDCDREITLNGGNLFVDLPQTTQEVTIVGQSNGNVAVTKGNADIKGSVNKLQVYGGSDDNYLSSPTVRLLGTAETAELIGSATLNIATNGNDVGKVNNANVGVSGVGATDESGTLYYGDLGVSNTETIPVQGTFHQVSDNVKMCGNLAIQDIRNTQKVSCSDESLKLEILGDSKNKVRPQSGETAFALEGNFGTVDVRNVGITLLNTTVKTELNATDADLLLKNARIGVAANRAKSSIQNSVVSVMDGSAVFVEMEAKPLTEEQKTNGGKNEIHVAKDSIAKSYVGVMGNFDAVTGKVFTCDDLTVNGTKDKGNKEVYGADAAVIVGGMTAYDYASGDGNGMKWALTVTDDVSDATVTLDSAEDSFGTQQSPGFSSIVVNDSNESNKVSLTMAENALPVNIGQSENGKYHDTAVQVTGDENTEVILKTNDIYGRVNGVSVSGTSGHCVGNVTLTGASATAPLKTLVGDINDNETEKKYGNGAVVSNGNLNLTNYDISGTADGVVVKDNSVANLTNVTITDKPKSGTGTVGDGTGLKINGSSKVTLDNAEVNGKTAVSVAGHSTLTFNKIITLNGVDFGLNVAGGSTVTNYVDDTPSGTGTVKASAAQGVAMKVDGDGSTVTLNGYNFEAPAAGGKGVVTVNDAKGAKVELRHTTAGTGTITGEKYGVNVGKGTTVILSGYRVNGTNASYGAAAKVDGTSTSAGNLYLDRENTFNGGKQGIYVHNGTVTNLKIDNKWPIDKNPEGTVEIPEGTVEIPEGTVEIEKLPGASFVDGSGKIYAQGKNSSALLLEGEKANVVLKNYGIEIDSIKSSGDCYGLNAAGGRAYLIGDGTQQINGGSKGCGVRVNGGATVIVDKYELTCGNINKVPALVTNGTLNLGKDITTDNTTTGKNTVCGESVEKAKLFSFVENKNIRAEGNFQYATGYVTTTGNLTVASTETTVSTETTGCYSWPSEYGTYQPKLSIKGGATKHDLILGSGKVEATLVDGSEFASVKVDGTSSVQQSVTVEGGLTVTNTGTDINKKYGIQATYTDLTFAKGNNATSRNITATGIGAAALDFGDGVKAYLSDAVNAEGTDFGMKLTGTALVTNLKNSNGWVTTFGDAASGTAQGDVQMLAGTTGAAPSFNNALYMEGTSCAFVGNQAANAGKIAGDITAVNVTGKANLYLANSAVTTTDDRRAISNAGNKVVNITTSGEVTLKNCGIEHLNHAKDGTLVYADNGTTRIEGGTVDAKANSSAITLAGSADLTLTGVTVSANKAGINAINVNGTAKLTVQPNTTIQADNCDYAISVDKTTNSTATVVMNGGKFEYGTGITPANKKCADIKGQMWITGLDEGYDSDAVFYGNTTNPGNLYIKPAVGVKVTVAGTFANITGAANLSANASYKNLVIQNTADDAYTDNTYASGKKLDSFEVLGSNDGTTAEMTLVQGKAVVTDGTIAKATFTDGTMTVNGGKVTALDMTTGTMTVTNGEVSGLTMDNGTTNVTGGTLGNTTVKGGTLTANGGSFTDTLTVQDSGNVTLTDNASCVTLAVNGGEAAVTGVICTDVTVSGGKATLTGDTCNSVTVSGGTATLEKDTDENPSTTSSLTVSGGTAVLKGGKTIPTVKVTGGKLDMTNGWLATKEGNSFSMGNTGKEVAFELENTARLTGTVSVEDSTITALPNAVGSGSFNGWKNGSTVYKVSETNSLTPSNNMTMSPVFAPTGGGGRAAPTYPVSIPEQTGNGTVDTSKEKAAPGEKVTLTLTPEEGYTVDEVTVLDQKGNPLELTKVDDTHYTFQMPAGTVSVDVAYTEDTGETPSETPFTDVKRDDYFYAPVQWAVEKGITQGMGDDTFQPQGLTTRGQMVTFLWRAAGSPAPQSANNPFLDVTQGKYYEQAVLWAVENGITNGMSDTEFAPDAIVNRAQTVTFLARLMNGVSTTDSNPFTDVSADQYYYTPVLWAAENGITTGTEANLFAPGLDCTRGQVVTFLYRCFPEEAAK